jgi:hypothetical protein
MTRVQPPIGAGSTGRTGAGPAPSTRPWFDTPNIRRVLVLAAILGLALGIETVVLHLRLDPLADVHAYYDAGQRLNDGQALYVQPAGTNDAAFYRYPPLLAIVFRPLARLSFETAASIWEAALLVALALTIVRVGPRRPATWVVAGMLALPTGWAIVIGQAQVLVTLLMALGAPWALALATNLKLFPALVALWWIGRRDWPALGRFAAVCIALVVVQLALAPQATLDYLPFLLTDQVGQVASVSPFVISPILWLVLVVAGVVAALRWAPTRAGWAIAVAVSVLASPRLLVYQLTSLLAGLREPRGRAG